VINSPARKRNKAGQISEADLLKLPAAAQRQIRAQLGTLDQAEAKASSPKQIRAVERRRRSLLARIGTRLRLIAQTKRFKIAARDLGRCKTKTLRVRARHETDAIAKAQTKLGRGFDQFRVRNCGPGLYEVKAAKRNPSRAKTAKKPRKDLASSKVRKIREKFSGQKSRKVTALRAPDGTPSELAKLGRVVSITTTRGKMSFARNPGGEVWLCADSTGNMHLASSRPRLTDAPRGDLGEVIEIEYLEAKPHLGHKKPTLFFHEMGEQGGRKPHLVSDGKGGLKFRGGDYRITREGIED
jgi:hypothetical protein